jgi:hypothetical protein
MLTKLTAKQIKLMYEIKQEWIDRFNSLEFDEEKSKEFIDFLYKLAGKEKPIKIILDSPLALQFANNMFTESQVGSQVRSQVWSQVESQEDLTYFNESMYGRCDDAGWVSFYDFFDRLGLLKSEEFSKYKNYLKGGLFSCILQDKIAFLSRPPVFLKRDDKGNMHNTEDYAIYFKDGYGLNFVYGVYFNPEDFDKLVNGKKATGKQIMQVKNAEQKTALIKVYGYETIISSLKNVSVIDMYKKLSAQTGKETVCELIEFDINERVRARVLKVEDHSVHKVTFLGVPMESNTDTCLKALAWSFGVSEDEYGKAMVIES